MFEKVNPSHPDKVADRIAGAIVDMAYKEKENPKIAVEVLIGHNECNIIIETDCKLNKRTIKEAVCRISSQKKIKLNLKIVKQDAHLAENQKDEIRCGDNGIFKGIPVTREQKALTKLVKDMYEKYPSDGKYLTNNSYLVVCQSNAKREEAIDYLTNKSYCYGTVNPLGDWTGGINVDSGATNRKLGSDMGDSVTGGGLHGKDLSKADVSVNIYAWLKAQETKKPVKLFCAIGDRIIDGVPYSEIVETAREFIKEKGGFEKFAEW